MKKKNQLSNFVNIIVLISYMQTETNLKILNFEILKKRKKKKVSKKEELIKSNKSPRNQTKYLKKTTTDLNALY